MAVGRAQRGCRDADGDEDAGPGMQRGFKSAGGEEEDDGARTQEGLQDAPGFGGSGTSPAQGHREENLGVLTGEQTEMQGEFKGAGAEARGLHEVLTEEDRDTGKGWGVTRSRAQGGMGPPMGRAGMKRTGDSGAGDSPRMSWARARHVGAKWTQCPHQEAKNSTAQALVEPSSRPSASGPSSSSGSAAE